jgi:hypothetical protein
MGFLGAAIRICVLLTIACGWTAAAAAGAMPKYGVFVYSNLCIEDDSGDAAGFRITLHRYPEGDSVMYEYAEGSLAMPLMSEMAQVDQRSGSLRFTVNRPGGQAETIIAQLANNGESLSLRGRWCAAPDAVIRLPRIKVLSQRMQRCRPCP